MDQREEIERVGNKIEKHILIFALSRIDAGSPCFYMEDLVRFVQNRVGVAPDSASRILRMLRQAKKMDYEVVSRSDSYYRIKKVGDRVAPP